MNILPKYIKNIILDYKYQLELYEKIKKINNQIKNIKFQVNLQNILDIDENGKILGYCTDCDNIVMYYNGYYTCSYCNHYLCHNCVIKQRCKKYCNGIYTFCEDCNNDFLEDDYCSDCDELFNN